MRVRYLVFFANTGGITQVLVDADMVSSTDVEYVFTEESKSGPHEVARFRIERVVGYQRKTDGST